MIATQFLRDFELRSVDQSALFTFLPISSLYLHRRPYRVQTGNLCDNNSDLPFIESRELVLAFLIPLAPPLEVVLVVQTAADGAPPRQPLRDVLPLHPAAAELDDQRIFLGRPLALLLRRRLRRVWRHAALSVGSCCRCCCSRSSP